MSKPFQLSLFYDLQAMIEAFSFYRKYYLLFEAPELDSFPDKNRGVGGVRAIPDTPCYGRSLLPPITPNAFPGIQNFLRTSVRFELRLVAILADPVNSKPNRHLTTSYALSKSK